MDYPTDPKTICQIKELKGIRNIYHILQLMRNTGGIKYYGLSRAITLCNAQQNQVYGNYELSVDVHDKDETSCIRGRGILGMEMAWLFFSYLSAFFLN